MKSQGRDRDVLDGRTERVAYESILPEAVEFRSLEAEDEDDEGIDPAWFDRPAPERSTDQMPTVGDEEPEPDPLPPPPPLFSGAYDLAAYDVIEVTTDEGSSEISLDSLERRVSRELDAAEDDPGQTSRLVTAPPPELAFEPVPARPSFGGDTLALWGRPDTPGVFDEGQTLPGEFDAEKTLAGNPFAEGTGENRLGCRRGLVAVFAGARGGAGTTTLSVNVATRLAGTGRRVCLVDLDLELGGVAGVLSLTERAKTPPLELARVAGSLHPEDLRRRLARHQSGLRVLSASGGLDLARERELTGELDKLLAILAGAFDFVVVDAGAGFGERARRCLRGSDLAYLVTTQEAPALRRAERLARICGERGLAAERLRLVINRYQRRRGAALDEIESAVGVPVLATVANDYRTVLRSHGAGRPIAELVRKRRIARDLCRLADLLGRQPAPLALPLTA